MSRNGFLRQDLQELIEHAQTDIEANLPGAIARLPQSNLDALAAMAAGMTDEQLEGIDYYATQIHVTTASGIWLERHGSEWGILRKEATTALGTLTVVLEPNTIVAAGALFQTAQRWQVRTTAEAESIPGGPVDIPAQALETGPLGNLAAGVALDTVNPIVGVTTGAIVASPGFAGGTSRELDEPYRARILFRIQQPPQAGARHDYIAWMLAFPGCTRAWCNPREQGSGTIVCRFAMDETYPNGIPPTAEVARMAAYLDMLRPVTAEVFVYAPVARPIDVIVRDLTPNTPAVRGEVYDEITDMLFTKAEPGATVFRSWFWEAISIASGERHHTLDEPTADIRLQIGELGVLGTLDFVATRRSPR